jgi:rubrerythrin
VEKVHAQLYQKLLDNLSTDGEAHSYYVCPICGYTAEQEVTGACPVCGAKGSLFKKIN